MEGKVTYLIRVDETGWEGSVAVGVALCGCEEAEGGKEGSVCGEHFGGREMSEENRI